TVFVGQVDRGLAFGRPALDVAQVTRIDHQIARERPSESLVGGHQGAQPLVDLAVHPLAALLDRHHHHQPDADADQGDEREAEQRRSDALPGGEIEEAHGGDSAVLRGAALPENRMPWRGQMPRPSAQSKADASFSRNPETSGPTSTSTASPIAPASSRSWSAMDSESSTNRSPTKRLCATKPRRSGVDSITTARHAGP